MAILVIAEHDNSTLKRATLHAVEAAAQIAAHSAQQVHLLIAGQACASVAQEAAQIKALARVVLADHAAYEHQLSENLSQLIAALAPEYSHILAAASSVAKSTLPRVAALLDVNQISEITRVVDGNTYQRPIYAGNALATVRSHEDKRVISVRTTGFEAATSSLAHGAAIAATNLVFNSAQARFEGAQLSTSERPELISANTVISGGRGMGSGDNFTLLEPVADKLGAAIGASRAAVDAGYVGNDLQVGQTGKIVAPELYIAVGISGAIQHLAGMKDSKVIVAINSDPEAPIFSVADYTLNADLFEALPELAAKI
ncbi:MAG: electron transfer flavoprotein subunit alpha/FixB family protein [Pseudomonadales bacterium]